MAVSGLSSIVRTCVALNDFDAGIGAADAVAARRSTSTVQRRRGKAFAMRSWPGACRASLTPDNDDPGSVVAAHDVNSYSHKNNKSAERNTHPRSCGKGKLRTDLHGHDLAALVIAAGRADAMGPVGRRALRAGAELRQFQHAVVSPTHTLTALRWFSLGNAHISFSVSVYPIHPKPTAVSSAILGILRARGQFQAAALRFTQRMLRKGEENIFAHIGRQVYQIVG